MGSEPVGCGGGGDLGTSGGIVVACFGGGGGVLGTSGGIVVVVGGGGGGVLTSGGIEVVEAGVAGVGTGGVTGTLPFVPAAGVGLPVLKSGSELRRSSLRSARPRVYRC